MIKAVIFDMDGLLINSEPFWQQAEMEIFKKVNVPLTREMCVETMGLRIDEVITHWYRKFPWENVEHEELQEEIITRVIKYINLHADPMDGVYEILEFFRRKNLKLALASSSHFKIIEAVLKKLNIRDHFAVVHSGELEEFGKPHPGIYISTARLLNVAPVDCIAFEDSFNGLLASRSARMKSVAIPAGIHFPQSSFDIAHLKLQSLKDFNQRHFDILQSIST